MTTAEDWLRQRYGAYRGHPAWRELEEAFNAGYSQRIKSEAALQRMVDMSQEAGFYNTPFIYAGRAVTTTVTDPAEIRKVFELDTDADYQPPPDSGFAKL